MRKNSLSRQVRRAYSQDKLARVCTLREDRFGRAFGMETVKIAQQRLTYSGRPEDYYHFRDNGSRVLAVAHLDTVVRGDRRTPRFRETHDGPLVTSGALDDRLGAYVILDLLPKMGVTCDWLLTVGEESGQSTAESFKPGKDYDHVIEFDRMGTDVVMYQYEDRASRRLVEAAGAKMGRGSFSDIAYLEQLDVKAFNWGVGYRGNYHSEKGYAYLIDTFSMVAKYLRFHDQNAGTAMPHESLAPRSYGTGKWDDEYYNCLTCGENGVVDSVTLYCTFCGVCADCGGTDPDLVAEWNDPDVDACQCYTPRHIREEAAGAGSSDVFTARVNTAERLAELRDEAAAYATDIRVSAVTTGRITSTPGRLAGDLKGLTWAEYPGAWSDDGGKTWHSTEEPEADGHGEICADCGKSLDECPCETFRPTGKDELSASEYCLTCEVPAVACTCGMMAAYRDAVAKDGPGKLVQRRSPSIAPPWSEHRVSGTGWADGSLGAAAQRAIAPPHDGNWHETVVRANQYLDDIPGHAPDPQWAKICLRCAARWPHPVGANSGRPEDGGKRDQVITAPGGSRLHAERDCPGCKRCRWAETSAGTIHVIPAHFPGTFADDGTCGECHAMERVFPDADLAAGELSASDR